MTCPVCAGNLSADVSMADAQGRRVILQGRVNAVVNTLPGFTPFSDYFTVSLYPRKSPVKYLKFGTLDDLNKWGLVRGMRIKCEGCLHLVDGKELMFDVTRVEVIPPKP